MFEFKPEAYWDITINTKEKFGEIEVDIQRDNEILAVVCLTKQEALEYTAKLINLALGKNND